MSTATLSLYRLDAELTDLLAYRQERIEDRDSPASAEELEACDGAIRQYMEQLPRKVDGVAAVLRYFDEQVDFADREIRRLEHRKSQIEDDAQRLKDCAASVLEKQPLPAKGCRKLEGSHSTLMLKGNGGVAPLVISDPSMVPDELCCFEGRISSALYGELLVARVTTRELAQEFATAFRQIPSQSLIREALQQPCADCDGTGKDYDTSECDEHTGSRELPCSTCGGSGKNAVPGCRLEERGSHVEIR